MSEFAPCHRPGQPMNQCAAALHAFQVLGLGALGGDHWRGWRLAGRELVSPDGHRLSARRLAGLIWRDAQEQRIAARRQAAATAADRRATQPVKVVVVTLREFQAMRAGAA